MRYTINLNDELCIPATEVGKEGTNRHLPGKFYTTELPITEACPQLGFRHCLLASKRSCSNGGFLVWASHGKFIA
jgi:hypothetical protein